MKIRSRNVPTEHPSGGKDLQDLKGLAHAPVHSLFRKIARPSRPRSRMGGPPPPAAYQVLAAFASSQTWQWLVQYLRHRFGPRHRFQVYEGAQSGIYPLGGDGDEVRLALAGDWGTGTDEAAMVAQQIVGFDAHYTIHLGDVYYVGDGHEVLENFLGETIKNSHFKPVTWPRGSRGSFSLLGNHEMYARGIAYFTRILPWLGEKVDGAYQGQAASFFCLENAFWRVIAVDTGYNSVGWPFIEYVLQPGCALPPELIAWLAKILPDDGDTRGIILLSHHQYFSAFDDWYPKAALQLSQFLKRPVLWFWGHEHRMTIYDKFSVKGGPEVYARCIGHGGMPVDLPPTMPAHPECPVLFVDERPYKNDENLKVGVNGFVRLTFRAAQLHVDYVDFDGTVLYAEEWSVENGQLLRASGAPLPLTTAGDAH